METFHFKNRKTQCFIFPNWFGLETNILVKVMTIHEILVSTNLDFFCKLLVKKFHPAAILTFENGT